MPHKSKIIIIEPSPVIRQGIKVLLENSYEFIVTGMYCDVKSFYDDIKKDKVFDAILINPAVISFYKQFAIRAIIPDYPDAVITAIIYGYTDSETIGSFDGALDIYDDDSKMVKTLHCIIKNFTSGNNKNENKRENINLSDREKEILISIAKGLTNKEIADKHFISVHTVVSHRKNISRKTGIKTVSGLTIYAVFNNLISQDDL